MKRQLSRLLLVTHGCRDDMHEPDNQGITCEVRGNHLDNAMGDDPVINCGELTIGITRQFNSGEEATAWFNLADIIALARMANLPESEA